MTEADPAVVEIHRIERISPTGYRTHLKDKHRPPSKGGNTRAYHQHVLKIADDSFAFLALGAKKWAFAGDTISFDWRWDASGSYRNIDPDSVQVWTAKGEPVVRGERGTKPWRTAATRLPARRSEWND